MAFLAEKTAKNEADKVTYKSVQIYFLVRTMGLLVSPNNPKLGSKAV